MGGMLSDPIASFLLHHESRRKIAEQPRIQRGTLLLSYFVKSSNALRREMCVVFPNFLSFQRL